ncbi:MAG: haloacid dehalogenase-like hydrolase [Oscillospiraceae bacterium]|nr:haloacid dehalogenase-like hydrolase [Oscillospiraceae bacterium]
MRYDIYDFDGTVYRHESESRFYLFCLLRRPYILPLLPYQLFGLALRLTKRGSQKWMRRFFCFLHLVDSEKLVRQFWQRERKNIREFFLPQNREHLAVVCSASPQFLLEPICDMFAVDILVCTKLDSGKILRGKEKVPAILAAVPNAEFLRAYSDKPKLDAPMLALASEQYWVKRSGEIVLINEY